jgi:hypothetical protein
VNDQREEWSLNYFNYFTEVEEHFQQARGTALFLMSPLDWALVETWKNGGVPLAAVLRGIDAAFEKWRAKKSKTRSINSLAYCAQAVLEEAKAMEGTAPRSSRPVPAPFEIEDLRRFLLANAGQLRSRDETLAEALEKLAREAEEHFQDLEDLERRLSTLEEKMIAAARAGAGEEQLLGFRRDMDRALAPYRGKMTADQLAMLERNYLDSRLMESAKLPRLSLFYLR